MCAYIHTKQYVSTIMSPYQPTYLFICISIICLSPIYLIKVSITCLFKTEFKYEYSYHLPLEEGTVFFWWG